MKSLTGAKLEKIYLKHLQRVATIFYPHLKMDAIPEAYRWEHAIIFARAWQAAHIMAAEPTARDRAKLKRQLNTAEKKRDAEAIRKLQRRQIKLRSTIKIRHRPENVAYQILVDGLRELFKKIYSVEPPATMEHKRLTRAAATWEQMLKQSDEYLSNLLLDGASLPKKRNIMRYAKARIRS
jgi:hypothetical protein